jgi:hypothetical protein
MGEPLLSDQASRRLQRQDELRILHDHCLQRTGTISDEQRERSLCSLPSSGALTLVTDKVGAATIPWLDRELVVFASTLRNGRVFAGAKANGRVGGN